MKTLTKDLLLSALMGLVLPGMLLQFADMVWDRAVQAQQTEPTEICVSIPMPVKVRHGEDVTESDMDAYLVGVVLKEMPVSFETEALKAQAVVARTYAWKAYTTGGKHGDGSVCTEPSCCQAWVSEEAYLQQGGSAEDVEKHFGVMPLTVIPEGKIEGLDTEDSAAIFRTSRFNKKRRKS